MKLGTYITKLMTTVVDKEADDFMKNLAWDKYQQVNYFGFTMMTDLTTQHTEKLQKKKQKILYIQEIE